MSTSQISLQKIHVAVLAFPFSTHARPLLNLVLKLANSAPNIQFSFFSTQTSNQSSLSSSKPSIQLPLNISLYDVEDGVPSDHRFTGNPLDLFLNSAAQNLTRRIESVVAETGVKISCIISDSFLGFADEIAENFNASLVAFWISMPCALSAHLYTDLIRKKCAAENLTKDRELDFVPGLSMLCVKDLPAEVLCEGESVLSKTLSQIGEKISKADAVIVNCFEELNPEELNNDLKSKLKNYLNVGFLSLSLPPPPQLPESDSDQTGCLSWLDRQSSKSVAYISFGTAAELPEKELQALAEALEFSRFPFLWSLKDNLRSKLPNGFVERTKEQGKIVTWAPQTLVLAHDSVAVFISHAGYNSVCESIVYGVPMVCRPVFGDHKTIARLVEVEWGMGVTVEDGVITKHGLLKNLEMFLPVDDERGKKMRENVEQLKKVVLMAAQPNGSAARDFNKLLDIISMV